MGLSVQEFADQIRGKFFGIPKLTGIKKKFVDHLKKHGAHYIVSGKGIEEPFYQELIRESLALGWLGVIPSWSLTIHA